MNKFKYIGLTLAYGKIYEKEKSRIVVYTNKIRYWPDKTKAFSIDRKRH